MREHQGFAVDIEKGAMLWSVSVRHPSTDRLHYGFFEPTGNEDDFLGFLDSLVIRARRYEDDLTNLRGKK